jgi:hypothetical protein
MIPIAPILIGIWISQRRSGGPSRVLWTWVLAMVLMTLASGTSGLVSAALWATTFVVACAWHCVRLAMWFGAPRIASALSWLADWTCGPDHRGSAALVAALTCHMHIHDRNHDRQQQRIAAAHKSLARIETMHATSALAAAIMAFVDGDADRGRALLRASTWFDARSLSSVGRRVRAEWWVTELLANGTFHDLVGVAPELTVGSPLSRFLVDASTAIALGEPPRSWKRIRLGWRFVRAAGLRRGGARAQLHDLYSRALHASRDTRPTTASEGAQRFVEEVEALQQTLEDKRSVWSMRAKALGVADTQATWSQLEAHVQHLVAAWARDRRVDAADVDASAVPVLAEHFDRAQQDLCDIVMPIVDAMKIRASGPRTGLPILDELGEFAVVAETIDALRKAGSSGAQTAHEAVHWPLCEWAVSLWNQQKQKPLANAAFRWLLDDAERVNNAHAIGTQHKNVKCGVG